MLLSLPKPVQKLQQRQAIFLRSWFRCKVLNALFHHLPLLQQSFESWVSSAIECVYMTRVRPCSGRGRPLRYVSDPLDTVTEAGMNQLTWHSLSRLSKSFATSAILPSPASRSFRRSCAPSSAAASELQNALVPASLDSSRPMACSSAATSHANDVIAGSWSGSSWPTLAGGAGLRELALK
jgi:hypothetical protein